MTTYCEPEDVKVYVGTLISDADLLAIIKDADAQIDAYFSIRGLSLTDTSIARQASILLTRSFIATRLAMTGESPTSYSSGDYSQSGSTDFFSISKVLSEQAYTLLGTYGATQVTNTSSDANLDVTRSDATMPDFHLDQTEDPTFYKESVTLNSDGG